MIGRVKWWNDAKGFGFLTDPDGGPDVFVHYSVIEKDENGFRTLRENQIVNYECQQTIKGLAATAVRLVGMTRGSEER